MGTLHETGDESDCESDDIEPVVWWEVSKWDRRVCGPASQVFPRPDGWLLDDQKVSLDKLNIRKITHALTMRRFVKPACEPAWEMRLTPRPHPQGAPNGLPWPQIWKMKSFFATPRDKMAGLKLQHRNLYLPDQCLACDEDVTQGKMLHYCECAILRVEYWDEVLRLFNELGMPTPADKTAFIATGAISATQAIGPNFAGLWFIAHRALYAAMMHSHLENVTLDLEKAHKRTIAMTIGRLRAYAARWREWVETSIHQDKPNTISAKHRSKALVNQEAFGDYSIAEPLLAEAKRLKLLPP